MMINLPRYANNTIYQSKHTELKLLPLGIKLLSHMAVLSVEDAKFLEYPSTQMIALH